MADIVTICNAALARIGDSASVSSIDPPDGSTQANACARFYPIALSSVLNMHPWSFAIRRCTVSPLASSMVEKGPWEYAYALPSDCNHVVDFQVSGASDKDTKCRNEFEIVGSDTGLILLTHESAAYVRYVCDSPKASQFSGLFCDAFSWLLASYLAGETIRGDSAFTYVQNCQKMFDITVARAMKQDSRLTHTHVKTSAPWIRGR